MGYPTVSNTFTLNTLIEPDQVNQNFTDLINGVSDGTKDIKQASVASGGAYPIKWKTFTGTLSTPTGPVWCDTQVHGLTVANIVGASVVALHSSTGYYIAGPNDTSPTNDSAALVVTFSATNYAIVGGTAYPSQAYRLIVFYI